MGWQTLWNKADTIRLLALHDEGHSFGSIAKTMEKTRNSIAGKLGRLGRLGTGVGPYRAKPWIKLIPVPRRFVGTRRTTVGIRPHQFPTIPTEPIRRPNWLGLKLIELTNETCRWPHGQGPYFFCGAPGCDCDNQRPYCPYHDRIAHRYVRAA